LLLKHLIGVEAFSDTDSRWVNLRSIVSRYLTNGTVLDAGSGTGHVSLLAAKTAEEVLSIDISTALTLGMKVRKGKLSNIHIIRMDATCLGFESGKLDCVLCIDLLEHLADDVACIGEAFRVLKSGGRLIIVAPAIRRIYGRRDLKLGHFRRYQGPELKSIVRGLGFTIRLVRYWNAIGFFAYLFYEKILRREIYEGMRYSRHGLQRGLNRALSALLCLENYVAFPIGLSIILVAEKN